MDSQGSSSDGFSGSQAGGGGFGPSSPGGMALGGIVTKRETKPKPTKKGLAAKRK
jgi:hypothetical protein